MVRPFLDKIESENLRLNILANGGAPFSMALRSGSEEVLAILLQHSLPYFEEQGADRVDDDENEEDCHDVDDGIVTVDVETLFRGLPGREMRRNFYFVLSNWYVCVDESQGVGALARKLAKTIQAKSRYLNEDISSAAGNSPSAEAVASVASDSADAPTSDSDSHDSEISCSLPQASYPRSRREEGAEKLLIF